MPNPARNLSSLRKASYLVLGFLMLAVIILSFVQIWFLYASADISAYGSVPADERGWPRPDKRGAFLLLNKGHDNPELTGDLIMLLTTTEPGVVDEQTGVHVAPGDIKSLLIQSAALGESEEYRVYRLAEPEPEKLAYSRQPGGKVLLIAPADRSWKPGAYIVDIPAEGMFGGRNYFQFYVDEPASGSR